MHRLRMCVYLCLFAAALATMAFAAAQQPTGDPFSTEIRKIKDGLFVIPGYDGAVTGGNVAVRVTSEGTIIVDDRLPPSSKEIAGKVRSVTSQPIKYVLSTHTVTAIIREDIRNSSTSPRSSRIATTAQT